MTRGLVLTIEPRVSTAAVAMSAKRTQAAQPLIAAAAMLEFEIDDRGICNAFALQSLDSGTAGEMALVTAIERKLKGLDEAGGRLVTFDPQADLGTLRLASLRHRHFTIGAAAAWQDDRRDSHDAISVMLPTEEASIGCGLSNLAHHLGGVRMRDLKLSQGPARPERIVAELAAIQTIIIYLHLLAERGRNVRPLAVGIFALSELLNSKLRTSPHLASLLEAEIFESFAPLEF